MNRLIAAVALLTLPGCTLMDRFRLPPPSTVEAAPAALRLQVASESPVDGWNEARDEKEQPLFLAPDVILTEFDISDAASIHSESTHGVQLAFLGIGADRLERATRENIGKRLAILVDDKIVMSPRIRSAVRDRAVITGDFTREAAQALANRLTPPKRGTF